MKDAGAASAVMQVRHCLSLAFPPPFFSDAVPFRVVMQELSANVSFALVTDEDKNVTVDDVNATITLGALDVVRVLATDMPAACGACSSIQQRDADAPPRSQMQSVSGGGATWLYNKLLKIFSSRVKNVVETEMQVRPPPPPPPPVLTAALSHCPWCFGDGRPRLCCLSLWSFLCCLPVAPRRRFLAVTFRPALFARYHFVQRCGVRSSHTVGSWLLAERADRWDRRTPVKDG